MDSSSSEGISIVGALKLEASFALHVDLLANLKCRRLIIQLKVNFCMTQRPVFGMRHWLLVSHRRSRLLT